MRIVLTGGGTGGHLYPLIAVAKKIRELSRNKDEVQFLFLGPDGPLEEEVMSAEFIEARRVLSGKLRRYFSARYLADIFKVPLGFLQSLWHLLVFMPDAIFTKGGFASVPVVLAGWIYRIPVLIHESDVTPGIANQISARFATRIAISFPGAANFFNPAKIFLSGNPIREEMAGGSREKGQQIFHLDSAKKTILVVGGSQGARSINEAVIRILPRLLGKYQIIHVTGQSEYDRSIHEAGKLGIKAGHGGYHPFSFLKEELPHALAAADLVVSRAGANALTEIAANKKPAIVIPIRESANNHQTLNAFEFAEAGAAVVLEQDNLGENILAEKIEEVVESEEMKYELGKRIEKLYNPKAAEAIATEIIQLAR